MKRSVTISLAVGLLGLVVLLLEGSFDHRRALSAYVAAFGFTVTTAVGALLFVMIAHTANARWFVVLRRVTDAVASTMPIFGVLFLPIALGMHTLYPWSHPLDAGSEVERAALLHQHVWMNPPFFIARAYLYLASWTLVASLLRRASVAQDREASPVLVSRQRNLSAAALPWMALSLTFASFDWLMSLNGPWVSDIFGVYVFAGGFSSAVGLTAVLVYVARARKHLPEEVSPSHFHALGRVLFVTVCLWTYLGFVQLLLVWIADLPREVTFYADRRAGSWAGISGALLVIHFIIPFFVLLSRPVKRRPRLLAFLGGWMVVAHALDMYWLAVPPLHKGANVVDLSAYLALTGFAAAFGILRFFRVSAIPVHDPDLAQSLRYHSP